MCLPNNLATGQFGEILLATVVPDKFMRAVTQAATVDGLTLEGSINLICQINIFW
jgi:hypothetical protein